MHGHMGPWAAIYFPRASAEQMIRTMDECGVKMLVFSHHQALLAPDIGNRPSIEAVRRFPAACVLIAPSIPITRSGRRPTWRPLRRTATSSWASSFWPITTSIPLAMRRNKPGLGICRRRGLLVLTHTWGGSPYDGPAHVRGMAELYPHVKLLLGHSFHGDWDAAVALARDYPNVYLELTAVFDDRGPLEKFVDEAGSEAHALRHRPALV